MRTSHRSFRIATWIFGLALIALFSFSLDVSAGERKPKKPLPRKGDAEKALRDKLAAEKAAQPVSTFIYTEIREFDGVKIDDEAKELEMERLVKNRAMPILKSGKATTPEEQKAVKDYVSFCVVRMTWEKNISDLPKRRDEVNDLLKEAGKAEDQQAHTLILATVVDILEEIAAGKDLHPASRYNALLLATELNQVEAKIGGGGEAVPYPEVLKAFLGVLRDVDAETLVKVGAMVGVDRHSQFPMDEKTRNNVVAEMGKFIVFETPNPTPIQGWLRRRALNVVLNMAVKAPDWQVPGMPATLAKLIANPQLEMPTRALAARALGELGATGMKPEDATALWKSLGEMAINIAALKPGSSSDDNGAVPADELDTKPFRDGAKYYLASVRIALEGMKSVVPAAEQENFNTLIGKINQMINACGSSKLSEAQLAGELISQSEKLGEWLDSLKPQPAAAAATTPTTTTR